MNIAVILAGGVGKRMGADIPKQFLTVLGKPVIVHTLEKFEQHPEIDYIEVVCVEAYINKVWEYAQQFNISKLKWVAPGGEYFQESVKNGIFHLDGICEDNDNIVIHMSVSPLIDNEIISDSLHVCKKYGNAVSVDPCIFSLCTIQDGVSSNEYLYKENYVTLNLPWTFRFKKILWAYKKAYAENIETGVRSYTTNLMIRLGERLYFSKGSQKNKLKLTTFDDVDMLEGYLLLQEKRKNKARSTMPAFTIEQGAKIHIAS